MIDIQNMVFTAVADPLREEFPGILVTSTLSQDDPVFPCVQVEEISNIPVYEDSADRSSFARLRYRVNVFTHAKSGKMQEARKIMAFVDGILEPMNFGRIGFSTDDGLFNNSVYLISTVYAATADSTGKIYRQ